MSTNNKYNKTMKNQQYEDEKAKQMLFVLEDMEIVPKLSSGLLSRHILWQIVPVSIASFFCTCFGIMLGWPSPTYPKLLNATTPIPITLDLTAMIAGFLMIGNVIGTPFSTWSYPGNKYGILIGLILMTIGWLIMWQARNFYYLLISRLIIGLGNGFGVGQLKTYIKEMCEPNLCKIFVKIVNIYMIVGILIVYVVGPFVDFRTLSLIGALFCIIIFFFCVFLPHTPIEYLRMGKEKDCKKMLSYLKPNNYDEEFRKLNESLELNEVRLTFGQILKKKTIRNNLIFLTFLIYFQQFTGPPATIVYSQIIFKELYTNRPEICAIGYIILFLFTNIYGMFYLDNFNKKYCLLLSSVAISVCLSLNIYVIYCNYNETYWNYISFIIMLFYIFFHTLGWGSIPFLFLDSTFNNDSKSTVTHYAWMLFSILALLITKLFQVLYENYPFFVPFCLFLCNSFLSFVFVLIFYPKVKKYEKSSKIREQMIF